MTYLIIKFAVTSAVVVGVSEIAKRSSSLGALLASLPLTSFLAFLWLYAETRDVSKVAGLSMSIFWLVLPSLVFFPGLTWLLVKARWPFPAAMGGATLLLLASYGLMLLGLRRLGVPL